MGETYADTGARNWYQYLSVSSNGSTWVKQSLPAALTKARMAFSILERIDVGETIGRGRGITPMAGSAFSILERIDVGETVQ